jgi:hypothetical protein
MLEGEWNTPQVLRIKYCYYYYCIFHTYFNKHTSIISGKAIGLPEEFIASSPGSKGGGVIQVSITCIILKLPTL